MAECTFTRTPSTIKIGRLMELLEKRTMTTPEIAAALGLTTPHASRYMKALHEQGRVHIATWTRRDVGLRQIPRPEWAPGRGKDAERPPAISKQEVSRAQYAKIKADPVSYAEFLAAARHRMRMRSFKAKPDPLVEAFFNKAA